jgi:sn-glycerol 3-phosphate transport system permease protein
MPKSNNRAEVKDIKKGTSLWSPAKKEAAKGYILIAPSIILLCIFTIYPIFYLITSSMYDGSLLSNKRNYVAFDNFRELFSSVDFITTLKNTIIYSIGLVAILMVLATLFAVWVNEKAQKRLNSVMLAAVFTPHIISLVSVSTVFLWLMDPQIGAINFILRTLGFTPFPFLSSSKTALASLIMMMVWKSLGYYSLLIIAALQGVPKEIYEAASIDDTPKYRTFFRITLPMISPTIFFTTIVATISSFQVFETINLMTQGGPINSTNTLVYMIYSDAFKYLKLGPATAEGVVLLAFVAVLTILYFTFLGKKVHYK